MDMTRGLKPPKMLTMSKTAKKADIVISGGGIAGLTLAVLLGNAGLTIHLVEPAPPAALKDTKPSARTVALMQSSCNILKETGVWPYIEHHANPMTAMRIIDDTAPDGRRIETEFESSDINQAQFGFNIPNSILRAALFDLVKKSKNITVHETALAHYNIDHHACIELKNETHINASLLVGTDGRNSKVRELAKIPSKVKNYNQSAITCLISHSRSHNNTATEFHRPSGPLAFVPMRGNRCAIVWVEPTDTVQDILRLKKQDFIALLQDKSMGMLGALDLESTPESWPLASIKADTLIAPRVALAAEAAHVMSPVTAQGLNLSLRDIAALAETIIDAARAGIDIGSLSVLKNYDRRRRLDIKTRVLGVDSMNSIIKTDYTLLQGLRRTGLRTVSSITPFRKIAMRQGLAPDMDSGRLARGLPL